MVSRMPVAQLSCFVFFSLILRCSSIIVIIEVFSSVLALNICITSMALPGLFFFFFGSCGTFWGLGGV